MYIRRSDAIKAVENLPNAYNGWSDAYDKACIIQTLEEVSSAKMDGEYIRREDAIKASWKALYDYQDEMETKFRESEDVDFGDWFIHRIFVQGVHGEILNRIVDIPAVEPKHGEWIFQECTDESYGRAYECSICGVAVVGNHHNFCPNCGAKMTDKDINVPNKEGGDDEDSNMGYSDM